MRVYDCYSLIDIFHYKLLFSVFGVGFKCGKKGIYFFFNKRLKLK
jgi:hypothetical protein